MYDMRQRRKPTRSAALAKRSSQPVPLVRIFTGGVVPEPRIADTGDSVYAANGQLFLLDFELNASFTLTVAAIDNYGGSGTAAVTIDVNNLDHLAANHSTIE